MLGLILFYRFPDYDKFLNFTQLTYTKKSVFPYAAEIFHLIATKNKFKRRSRELK